MREQIADIMRHCAPHFEWVRLDGTEARTTFATYDRDKYLFLQAHLAQAIPELEGRCVIADLPATGALLASAQRVFVHRDEDDWERITYLEMRPADGASARLVVSSMREIHAISSIPWDVTIRPTKDAIDEFVAFRRIMAKAHHKRFTPQTENGTLYLAVGDPHEPVHGRMAFATDVLPAAMPTASFDIKHMTTVLRTTLTDETEVRINRQGVIAIVARTHHAHYTYYLRGRPI
jgi:hypothetical protein